jgi:hypothetical protein
VQGRKRGLTRLLSETSGAEISIPIYIPKDESAFATLHENIIENRMKDERSSKRRTAVDNASGGKRLDRRRAMTVKARGDRE